MRTGIDVKGAAVLCAVAIALPLAACGSSGADDDAAASGGSTQAAPGGVRAATCSDATGDGGAADITTVELREGGEGLRATFALATPLDTASGSAQLSLLVSSENGEKARQLGAKWADGDVVVFVFDMGTAHNEYVQPEPVVDGSAVAVTFPRSALVGLGDTWNWRATTSVNGADVDDCPGSLPGATEPQVQRFPT